MNRIQIVNLEEFKTQYSFVNESDANNYEYLSGFSYLAKYRPNATITKNDILNINTGKGNDWGIDNFIILVNDYLVPEMSDLEDCLKYNSSIRVKIVLVQSKTSTSIDIGELSKFLKGSRDVLSYINGDDRESLPPMNDKLKEKLEILDAIYAKANLFDREDKFRNPRLHMYYVIGGEHKTNKDAQAVLKDNLKTLRTYNLVDDIQCKIVSANEICTLYLNTKNRMTCEFEIEHKMNMPKVDKISESHLCLIPFSEFKKIIIDNDDKLIKSIFEDNVRDFQGENRVNQAMAETLKTGKIKLFTAMNNGLTIIARNIVTTGTKMMLEDYQIVNGCQTCHVLYENRNIPGIDDLVLMIKIISSEDREIRDSIVVANNSQTEVKREQLTSLLEAQRNIERYYKAQSQFTKLYYERRSKQYSYGRENIPADHVITIPFQIMAYVSMVLGEPHLTSNYYGQIIEKFNGKNDSRKIFDKNSSPALYYMSALAAFNRDKWLSNGKIDRNLRHVKHHLLYALRLVINHKMPQHNSNNAESYCEEICKILCNEETGIAAFQKAGKLIKDTLNREPIHNDLNDTNLAKRIKEYFIRYSNLSSPSNTTDKIIDTDPTDRLIKGQNDHTELVIDSQSKYTGNNNTFKDNESNSYKREIPRLSGPKIIGKIDLSSINSRTSVKKKKEI